MNLKTCLFFTLFLTSIISFSQSFEFGILAGSNYSTIGGDAKNIDGKIDFHAGLFINKLATSNINYKLESVYSQQGANSSNTDIKFMYNYINTSLLIKFLATSSIQLFVGPQLGLRVKGKIEDVAKIEDVTEDLGTANFAIAGGLGFSLTSNINIIGRYNHGFSSNTSDIPTNQKYPFRVAQLSLEYIIK